MNRRTMLIAAIGASTTALTGCLGIPGNQVYTGDGTGKLNNPTDYAEVVLAGKPTYDFAVRYASLSFEPTIVHIIPSGTVAWQIAGHEQIDDHWHSITAYHPDTRGPQRIPDGTDPWDSGPLGKGDTFEHTFDQEGIYDYLDNRQLCISHESLGAIGRVIVGWPDIESEPAYRHNVGRLPNQAESTMAKIDKRTYEVFGE